jgi:hypothetical protein
MNDDVHWTIIGTTAWSKTYRGKQAVLSELLKPLNAQLENSNTMLHITLLRKETTLWCRQEVRIAQSQVNPMKIPTAGYFDFRIARSLN